MVCLEWRKGSRELLECRVLAFVGPTVLVVPLEPVPPAAEEWLAGGSSNLLVEHGDHFKDLPCHVRRAGDAFAVVVPETTSLVQRRWWSRAHIELSATLVAQPAGVLAPMETETLDVSPGGVHVRRPAGMRVWPRYELTLEGDGLVEPITVEAVPAHVREDGLSLRFSRIEPDDRERLTYLVLDHLAPVAVRGRVSSPV